MCQARRQEPVHIDHHNGERRHTRVLQHTKWISPEIGGNSSRAESRPPFHTGIASATPTTWKAGYLESLSSSGINVVLAH